MDAPPAARPERRRNGAQLLDLAHQPAVLRCDDVEFRRHRLPLGGRYASTPFLVKFIRTLRLS
jgi:hypothetical protein